MANLFPTIFSKTSIVGATFAVIEVEQYNNFVISSCNQLFFEMIGAVADSSLPLSIREVLDDVDSTELSYYLSLASQKKTAVEFEFSLSNHQHQQWWLLIITPLIDDNQPQEQLFINGINISAKKLQQQRLVTSHNRYRSVVQSVHDCIVTMDEASNIVLFNKAAEQTWGYSHDEVVGKNLMMLLPTKYRQYHQRYVDGFSASDIQSREMSRRSIVYGQRKNGSKFPAEISISKMNVNGKSEFTAIVRDISERERLLEELHHQATTDGLTGIKNRLFFEQELTQTMKRSAQSNSSLAILLIDLDNFKLVNDNHGHAIGDRVLITFAQTVGALLEEHQLFARYGGEEFIVLLPELSQTQAHDNAQLIFVTCANQKHDKGVRSTVSIGVSLYNRAIDDNDSFIHRADMALYEAKAQGRNQVQFKTCDYISSEDNESTN